MAREPRKTEVAQERRSRRSGTLDRMQQLKLSVPKEVEEANEGFSLRWINDDGNRIYAKTKNDDWDVVPGTEKVPVGTDKTGKPIYAHLCRKPLDFVEAHQKAHMEMLKERERGLVKGERDAEDDTPEDKTYVPKGNSINPTYSP